MIELSRIDAQDARFKANHLSHCRLQRRGKTTFAKEFLPHEVKCLRFHNADEMARGLSPLDPFAGAIKARPSPFKRGSFFNCSPGNFRARKHAERTTCIRIFRLALSLGYELELHYLWLATPEQAIARVGRRGHDIPAADIRRRFKRAALHLVDLPLATRWVIWDSRGLIAKRLATSVTTR